jgi:hypothetical protein
MIKKIYQVHYVFELSSQIIRSYEYCIAREEIEAKSKIYSRFNINSSNENTEVYALEVNENTLISEINHCKELISFWQLRPLAYKVDVIILRQQNLIKHYEDIIEELKDA